MPGNWLVQFLGGVSYRVALFKISILTMKKENVINTNGTDLLTSVAKSSVGIIPFAGPLLSEIVGTIIPNQRLDRLSKYIKELEKRISKIESSSIDSIKENEEFIDLIEEGFVQASRAITKERRQYIASIIENGIKDEAIDFLQSKYLLKLLSELNDIEIIWLRFYYDPAHNSDNEFRNKHKNVLKPIRSYIGTDKESHNGSAIQNSYKEHLERLQLIEGKIKFDRKTGFPEFDKSSGKPKTSYRNITYLGKMLLEQIGILNN